MVVLRNVVLSGCLFLLPAFTSGALAEPITLADPAVQLSTLGGEVTVFFAGSEAAYDLQLLQGNSTAADAFFPNHDTPIGTSWSLGWFTPGTQLSFVLDVLTTGNRFFTGPASSNRDNVVHARGEAFAGGPLIPASGVLVGFEDMYHGGDMDFNDFTFVVSNVAMSSTNVASTPEPTTLLLVGGGLLGVLGAARRRRTNTHAHVNG